MTNVSTYSPLRPYKPVLKIVFNLFAILALMCINIALFANGKPAKSVNARRNDARPARTAAGINKKSQGPKIKQLNALAPPVISYASPQTYTAGVAITPLAPSGSGVSAPAYASNPVFFAGGFNLPQGVATDKAGNVYVADAGNALIKKYPAAGGTPVNIGAGFNAPIGIVVDGAGNVYVTDIGLGAIKEIQASNGFTVTIADSLENPTGIALDLPGNVYVTFPLKNCVLKFKAGGGVPDSVGHGFNSPSSVAVDATGNIYVTSFGDSTVKVIRAGTIDPEIIGSGFSKPGSVTLDVAGNIYIADFGNGTVKMMPPGGGTPVTLTTGITNPGELAIDKAGNLFVSDFAANTVSKLSPVGGYYISGLPPGLSFNSNTGIISGTPTLPAAATNYTVTAYNASGSSQVIINIKVIVPPKPVISYTTPQIYTVGKPIIPLVPTSSNVTAAAYGNTATVFATGLKQPQGIAIDLQGNIYVADGGNKCIKKFPPGGGAPVSIGTGTLLTSNIAVDAAGNIFVADLGNGAVKEVLAANGFIVTIGNLTAPAGIAVDAAGNLFVTLTTLGLLAEFPAGGGPPFAIASGLSGPDGVAVDAAGNVYVTDVGNNKVKLIRPGSAPEDIGSGFNQPINIALDPSGNIYVAELGGGIIKMMPPGGGTPVIIATGLTQPAGLAVDATGNIFVSDFQNSVIKKIKPAGGYYASGLPPGLSIDNNTGIISGTPTTLKPAVNFTVTGYNAFSNNHAIVNIKVNLPPKPTLSYAGPHTYAKAATIAPLAPASNGVGQVGYNKPITFATGFGNPNNIKIDAAGNIYVADAGNSLVQKFPAGGGAPVTLGSGFNGPRDIAIDAAGNVYVADGNNHALKKIPADGGAVITIDPDISEIQGLTIDAAGNLFFTSTGTNDLQKIAAGGTTKVVLSSGFSNPRGVAVAADGNIYVADAGANAVVKVPAGGGAGVSVIPDIIQPFNLAFDAAGNLYVTDFGHLVTKKFAPGSSVPVIVGGFASPIAVAVDAAGIVYYADLSASVKKLVPSGGYYVSGLPNGLNFDSNTGVFSGTPTTLSVATSYKVTAYNAAGGTASTAIISISLPQPPSISYHTPNAFTTGIPVNLSPANSGGTIPATIFSQVSTLAGSGAPGSGNDTGAAATFNGLTGMATDTAGNVYLADFTANIIRKVTPAGVATTLAGSGLAGSANGTGTAATFKNPVGIAVDAAGNIYVGDSGNNLIRKITPAGLVTTFAGSGAPGAVNATGTAATFRSPRGLAFDRAGNLYVADIANNLIRKITSAGVVSTFAGSGAAGAVNAPGKAASFNGPAAVATDTTGSVYVADYTNNLIRKITPAGVVSTFAGSGTAGAVNGTGTAASFKSPFALSLDVAGNIYVADRGNNLIRKITPAAVVTTLAGSTAGSVNETGTAAKFNDPRGVATDLAGNLYVSDFAGHQVRKILITGYTITPVLPAGLTFNSATGNISGTPTATSPAANYTISAYNAFGSDAATVNITVQIPPPNISYTTPHTYPAGSAIATLSPSNTGGAVPATIYSLVSTLAGSGAPGSVNGTGAAATFNGLTGMATDAVGNIYVADITANLIRKITPAGVVTTLAGSGAAGATNGTGTAATFKNPAGIAIDAAGNLYVGDSGNNLIRKITPAGVVTTFAGSGAPGAVNATGTAATFHTPRGLAFDGTGNLYVADIANNLIRKITSAGVVSTFAGSGAAGAVNATGTAASFNGPVAVATDTTGSVYVADYTNNLIRKITPAGVVSTFAGSGAAGAVNGTGTAASFKNPFALSLDVAGNIYVADRSNNLIRKITPAAVVTTLAGSTAGSVNETGTAAKFNDPRGVATDLAGNLYVSDFAGHQVRKVLITGYTITPALPAGLTFNSATGSISGTPTTASPATNYTVTAYNAFGSDAATVSITITAAQGFAPLAAETAVEAGAPEVKQGLSPNGDGVGDVLEITNIGNYPENTFQVMSRSGTLVYSVKGYDNVSRVFDGHSNINGKLQQAGTYFYQLEYNDKGKLVRKTGFILLKY